MTKDPLDDLVEVFSAFPGIGDKTAQRLAYWLVKQDPLFVKKVVATIEITVGGTKTCATCCAYSTTEICDVCADYSRDPNVICVVATTEAMRTFVRSVPSYKGSFHVLQGVINPMEGKGPETIRLKELFQRLHGLLDAWGDKLEVINALDGSVESEATGLYMRKQLAGVAKLSRIAFGLSASVDISSADAVSLENALLHRRQD